MPSRTYEEGPVAEQDLRGLRKAVHLAQALGAVLGAGEVLFAALPPPGGTSRDTGSRMI
ncbi:hypothetical protein PSEEN2740 [Pseudomonas entomophila L48]|uniref:Uncharacterized protein n=1 Tax=Pseudomonas entomophila (strain L48) TaxID=384676 RepID=Q1I9Z6_PSEE4|nr:hypothetical protein PSEEN2740 [Pseudomonas entomophila L48]